MTGGYVYQFNDVMAVYRINNPGSYNGRINQLPAAKANKKWLGYQYEVLAGLEYFNHDTGYRWDKYIRIVKNRYKYFIIPYYVMKQAVLENFWENSFKQIGRYVKYQLHRLKKL